MAKGAPEGNKYAEKDIHHCGISVSHYINSYNLDFLKKSLELEGLPSSISDVREKAKSLLRDSMKKETNRVLHIMLDQERAKKC